MLAFPAWGGKNGTDAYFSSRWDNDWQIYDHFHSAKSIDTWWQTAPWDWVFVQEAPFKLRTDDFVWDNAKSLPTSQELRKKRYRQRQQFRAAATARKQKMGI